MEIKSKDSAEKKTTSLFMSVYVFQTFPSGLALPKREVSSCERSARESRLKFRLRLKKLFAEIARNLGNTIHKVTFLGSSLGLIGDHDAQAGTLKSVYGVHRPLLVSHVPEFLAFIQGCDVQPLSRNEEHVPFRI